MKVLFVRMSCIGDMLHATPAARAIKKAWPDSRLYWIATPSFAPILKHNPYVDEIIEWERDRFEAYAKQGRLDVLWKMWWPLRERLQKYEFDLAVDVQGLLISGLVLLASGAKRKIGMARTKELNWLFTDEKSNEPYRHVIDRYLQVPHLLNIYDADRSMVLCLTDEEKEWARQQVEHISAGRAAKAEGSPETGQKKLAPHPIVALVPGTSWTSKNWLTEYWQELVQLLRTDADIIYIGGKGEMELAQQLPQGKGILNAVGAASIRETAALLDAADCVVSGDTGSLHMALALGVPVVGLYGPTDPVQWGPYQYSEMKADGLTGTVADEAADRVPAKLADAATDELTGATTDEVTDAATDEPTDFAADGATVLIARQLSCLNCRHRRCPKPGHPCMKLITPAMAAAAVRQKLGKY